MTHIPEIRYAVEMAPLELRTRIGELVKRRRELLGKSLRSVVATTGVAHSTLGHVENGSTNVTVDMLAEIAAVLKARWEIRLVGNDEAVRDPERRTLLARLDAVIDQLDDRDVRHLGAMLKLYEADLGTHGQSKT